MSVSVKRPGPIGSIATFDFAEKPLAFAILQKSQSLIVRHLGKAVFEQNRDSSEESNLCNTSL
jgi:hypothetical protein